LISLILGFGFYKLKPKVYEGEAVFYPATVGGQEVENYQITNLRLNSPGYLEEKTVNECFGNYGQNLTKEIKIESIKATSAYSLKYKGTDALKVRDCIGNIINDIVTRQNVMSEKIKRNKSEKKKSLESKVEKISKDIDSLEKMQQLNIKKGIDSKINEHLEARIIFLSEKINVYEKGIQELREYLSDENTKSISLIYEATVSDVTHKVGLITYLIACLVLAWMAILVKEWVKFLLKE